MKEFCKDFMGNDLKIGDYIAVSDKTYSKTPYIIYGQITNIEYEYTKSGDWSCTNIDYKFIGILGVRQNCKFKLLYKFLFFFLIFRR